MGVGSADLQHWQAAHTPAARHPLPLPASSHLHPALPRSCTHQQCGHLPRRHPLAAAAAAAAAARAHRGGAAHEQPRGGQVASALGHRQGGARAVSLLQGRWAGGQQVRSSEQVGRWEQVSRYAGREHAGVRTDSSQRGIPPPSP